MKVTDTSAVIATTTIRRRPSSCARGWSRLGRIRRSRILRDLVAAKKLVEVVLHVHDVVFDYESQRYRLIPTDETQYRQSIRPDFPHQPREKRVVFEPEVDDTIPLHP